MQDTHDDTTGRYIVLLRDDQLPEGIRTLNQTLGVERSSAATFRELSTAAPEGTQTCFIVFERIGIAVMVCRPPKFDELRVAAHQDDSTILAIEPERRVHALGTGMASIDESVDSWGIQVTGVNASRASGKNVRVAILDTGLDEQHPDFIHRNITSRSFISGETAHDGNGHGTHCAGIACGPATPHSPPRYGVAHDADIFIGKVLSDQGSGGDGAVLEGINWAVENDCDIVSMSLGSPAEAGQPHSDIFETVAQRALATGTVIIAAAGNESRRPEHIAPVSHPANCPSILAVAAVDSTLNVARFSNAGLAPDADQVDIAAPGVNIRSAWPQPEYYKTISGTSMAAPFVAGIAALYAQRHPDIRGEGLLGILTQQARTLEAPPRDVGAGLVQAPMQTLPQAEGRTPLSVVVHPDAMHRFADVVQCCRDAGLSVQKELTRIGVISGNIDTAHVDHLRSIDGVYSVEIERPISASLQPREPEGP